MTPAEFASIMEKIVLRWPMVSWDERAESGAVSLMGDDLSDLPGDKVAIAAEAYFREGNEWPPTAGQLRRKVCELDIDAPEWIEVSKAIRRCTAYLNEADREARLAQTHPLVRAFVRAAGWKTLEAVGWGDNISEGRARKAWLDFVKRVEREATYVGLPASGLPALERLSHEPRQLGEIVKQLPEAS